MTVPSTTRRAGPYLGNGVTVSFPFTFKVFGTSDIALTLTGADGISTTLVLDTDYSVALNPDQDTSPGGTITYPLSGDPLSSGETLVGVGALPYDQTTDLPPGGPYRAQTVEFTFDRTVYQIQQLAEELGRSLTLPPSAASADTELPAPIANNVIGWNATANALVNYSPSDIATVVVAGTSYFNVFNGDGSATQFVLTANPGSVNALDIAVDGVPQKNGIDFTCSGTMLTFTSAPGAGTQNVAVRYVAAVPVGNANAQDVTFLQAGSGAAARTVEAKLREYTSVADYAVPADGVTDASTALANAGVQVATTTKCLNLNPGTYNILTTPPNTVPIDYDATDATRVTGTIVPGVWESIPTFGHSLTNEYNLIDFTYKVATPDYAREDPGAPGQYPFGSMTMILEMVPGVSFRGNANALYVGTKGVSGATAALGGINALTTMEPGFLGNGNACEMDIDNFADDNKGLGVLVQGVGTKKCDTALKILRIPILTQSENGVGGWIPPYLYGIQLLHCERGLYVDQTGVENPDFGFLMKPGPQHADSDPFLVVQLPDNSTPWVVRVDGYFESRASAPITALATNVASLGPGIPGQTAAQYLDVTGFVQLAGGITMSSGSIASGGTVMTLDVAYRPNRTIILPVMQSNGITTWLQVTSAGIVTLGTTLTNVFSICLDAVSYKLTN